MTADPRVIELMSYYRDAELHGASLLLRLVRLMADDGDAQIKLSKHIEEETHHAWLWTKRIADLGGKPVPVADGYQTRIGRKLVPRSLLDLLALTIVVEERALARYREHMARPDVDPETQAVLHQVTKDEKWHIAWIRNKLEQLAAAQEGGQARAEEVMRRYREVEAEVYEALARKEREAFSRDAQGSGSPV